MTKCEYFYDNCKLSKDPSGIAPAEQAWIQMRNNYSSINSAQPSVQANWHIPLNGGNMKFYFLIILIIHSIFSIAQVDLKDSASNFSAMSIVFQVGHTKPLGQVITDFSKINIPNSNSPKLDSTYGSSPLFSYRFGTNYNLTINKKCFFGIGINYAQFSSNRIIFNSADVNINNSKIVRRDFYSKNLFISIGANFKFNKTIFNFTRYLNLYTESKMINSFFDETKDIINLQPESISNYEFSILTPLLKNEKLYLVITFQNRYMIRYDALFFSPLNMISFSKSYTASIGLSYHFLK